MCQRQRCNYTGLVHVLALYIYYMYYQLLLVLVQGTGTCIASSTKNSTNQKHFPHTTPQPRERTAGQASDGASEQQGKVVVLRLCYGRPWSHKFIFRKFRARSSFYGAMMGTAQTAQTACSMFARGLSTWTKGIRFCLTRHCAPTLQRSYCTS